MTLSVTRSRSIIAFHVEATSSKIQADSYHPQTAYWIAFGPHGPRAVPPPGEGRIIFWYTMLGVGVSFVIFVIIRQFARPAPKTMNAQYQAMTNEYLKVNPPKSDICPPCLLRRKKGGNGRTAWLTRCLSFCHLEPKNRSHHRCIV